MCRLHGHGTTRHAAGGLERQSDIYKAEPGANAWRACVRVVRRYSPFAYGINEGFVGGSVACRPAGPVGRACTPWAELYPGAVPWGCALGAGPQRVAAPRTRLSRCHCGGHDPSPIARKDYALERESLDQLSQSLTDLLESSVL